jgi:hypothetical protein
VKKRRSSEAEEVPVRDGVLSSSREVAEHVDEDVTVQGTYTVQDLGGHTMKVPDGDGGWRSVKQIAHVQLADGGFVELGARPEDELADLDGKVVEASGHLYVPGATEDPAMAARSPLPTLADISAVEAVTD